ncbi:hypothetical protein [Pseudomonas fluorescens]|uniref:hypothetical protein n=1 Tax=Pseudomonas fluorescens TaxID=294 RepID=UPI00124192D5|nr:hypothetical protein [Pseudomonas fluorescens]
MSAAAAVATALIAFQSIFQSVQSHIPFLRRRVEATALLKAGIQSCGQSIAKRSLYELETVIEGLSLA